MDDQHLTPSVIKEELDRYVIGQDEAKKAVAIALRNRWRRLNIKDENIGWKQINDNLTIMFDGLLPEIKEFFNKYDFDYEKINKMKHKLSIEQNERLLLKFERGHILKNLINFTKTFKFPLLPGP